MVGPPDATRVGCPRPEGALDALATRDVGCVVCEQDRGDGTTGLAVVRAVSERTTDLPCLLCTDETDAALAVEASRLGTECVSRADLAERGETLADREGGGTVVELSFRPV